MTSNYQAIQPLFEGPIDIIGDVHGEFEALTSLLSRLGYNENGVHPSGRRLVFVGDLVDRGPDSPSVVELVMKLMEAGTAQCILGNHELNILRGGPKDGNGWFCEDYEADAQRIGKIYPWKRVANPTQREQYKAFFRSLPLALVRDGAAPLRVAHAFWNANAISALQSIDDALSYFNEKNTALKNSKSEEEKIAIQSFKARYDLRDEASRPPLCTELAAYETRVQMNNPVKVITSGAEGPISGLPPYIVNQYRMVERLPWWESYQDSIPVVIGHYWRSLSPNPGMKHRRLFKESTPQEWLGSKRMVYCIDFSVGRRYKEREEGTKPFLNQLGALRTPAKSSQTWQVALSNGQSFTLPQPGAGATV